MGRVLVDVDSVVVDFPVAARGWRNRQRRLRAVDGVTVRVHRGETLALVGESGCGKTTLGRTLLRLYRPRSGRILFDSVDIATLKGDELLRWRRRAQMIFQDPYASLNPRLRVGESIEEPLRVHRVGSRADRRVRVRQLLELVGLPATAANRYPNSLSGGQRQRVDIARSLALEPDFVVADEPVSALDVSVQAQVLNLIQELQDQLGLTMFVISHDLAVVRQISTRVAVMYLGKLVELGPRKDVFTQPLHPYTQALLSAVPIPNPERERARQRIVLRGDPPSPIEIPAGCRFNTRCPYVMPQCLVDEPQLRITSEGHWVACHLVNPSELPGAQH